MNALSTLPGPTRPLDRLPLEDLVQGCRIEIRAYRNGEKRVAQHGYELFRRACCTADEHAWSALYELYYALVLTWIAHKDSDSLLSLEERSDLVNEVFAKFARTISPAKFMHFDSLQVLLAYLKCCALSVTTDMMRAQQARRGRETSLESIGQESESLLVDPADAVLSQVCIDQLWQMLSRMVVTEAERTLLQALYQQMKMQDIAHCYAALFRDVEDVYRVKRNLVERLRRNKELRAWCS